MKKQEKHQDHAVLAPSASVRWLHCPASVNLPQEEQKDTRAADEGTLAHAIAEYKLKRELEWLNDYKDELDELRQTELYDPEMEHYTDEYVKYVLAIPHDRIEVETKVKPLLFNKDLFGTCDCMIVKDSEVTVVDFKYGFGKVEAEANTQLEIYSLGAIEWLYENTDFDPKDDVVINNVIYQPRINNIDRVSYTLGDLNKWSANVLLPAIDVIKKDPELICEGDWCKYCKAKKACHDKQNEPKLEDNPNVDIVDTIAIGYELALADLKSAKERVEKYEKSITTLIKAGVSVAGYKLVQGNRKQEWSDERKVKNLSISENLDLFELISPAQAKKKLGKERFEEMLSDLITVKRNKPLLVKETDRRKALEYKN